MEKREPVKGLLFDPNCNDGNEKLFEYLNAREAKEQVTKIEPVSKVTKRPSSKKMNPAPRVPRILPI